MPMPEKYAGDTAQCKGFLLYLLYFASYEEMSEAGKKTHFMELLTGKDLTWMTAVWERGGEPISSYEQFTGLF